MDVLFCWNRKGYMCECIFKCENINGTKLKWIKEHFKGTLHKLKVTFEVIVLS